MPLNVGVIGLGVGERHVSTYCALPDCEVRAVCDIDGNRCDEVADGYGIPERHQDYLRITTHPDIDVVSICSYDDHHAAQAVSALEHGKHVMIEKPVALNRSDAEAILRAWQDSGTLLTSNLILRESPRFKAVRGMIRDGIFGDLFYLEGDYIHQILWKLTEGWRGKMDFYCVTYGGGIHLIDLMRWLVGQEFVEVTAMGNRILTEGSQFAYPDTMVSLLKFENDILAKSLTTLGPQRSQLHGLQVYGTKKTFINDRPDAKLFDGDGLDQEEPMSVPYLTMEKGGLLPDFIAAIQEGREPNVSAQDVFRVMDVCFAAWESLEQQRTVRVSYMI